MNDFHFEGKTLLITGGTGSFGNAVVRLNAHLGWKEIRVFSRDEKKQEDMRLELNDDKIKFYLGDVRDYRSVCNAIDGVDCIFHAAALKQVPSCEFYPMEAVKTNIVGAENVLEAAYQASVSRLVVLSTDKAVYPINAMGQTKALMEKLMVAKSRLLGKDGRVFCGTRYGNVMGSRGSVIPLFISQIKRNEPLTITDPSMTRFIMSLEESVTLVNYAFKMADPGDIFVQKAPSSTIADLATALGEIFKVRVKLKIIGTRHGEKLFETLLTREEMARADDLGAFYRIPSDGRDLNYTKYFAEGNTKTSLMEDFNSHNARRLNVEELVLVLSELDFVKKELSVK